MAFLGKGARIFSTSGMGLTIADERENPAGFNGFLEVQLTGNLLTLTHVEFNTDYQFVTVDVSNLVFDTLGEYVADVKLISSSIVDGFSSAPFTESLSFTGNSISLVWSVTDPLNTPDAFNFHQGGSATYEITFGSASTVPEPGAAVVFGLSALVVCLKRHRRVSST